MPELPEVETIRRQLSEKIGGLTIAGATVYLNKVIKEPSPELFVREIRGRKISGITRRGKYLLFDLSGGYLLVIHLRMSGQLVYESETAPQPHHTHMLLHLERGRLRLTDVRQFGRIWLLPAEESWRMAELRKLGPEPLSADFTETYLRNRLKNSRRQVKPVLLDQEIVAGIGNIYADEALHMAELHPGRRSDGLTVREVKKLYRAVKEVLQEGILHRGTSIQNYVDAEGQKGTHQDFLRVHNRAGQPCPRCGTAVTKIKLGGRGTYFCPGCQTLRGLNLKGGDGLE
ncbi:MAG: DNA-formamidopyrimidine glycosylase [Bacillota bacterium]